MSKIKVACPDCGKTRYGDPRNKTSRCKKCHFLNRKRMAKDPGHFRVKRNTLRLSTKRICIDYKGGKCERCGASRLPECCYQFHHIGNHKKEGHLSDMARGRFSPKIVAELNKCALLCANCHLVVHWAGNGLLRYNVAKGKPCSTSRNSTRK